MEKISFCRGHCPDLGNPRQSNGRKSHLREHLKSSRTVVSTVQNECVNKRGSSAWYLFSFSSPQPKFTSNSNGLPHSICFPQVHSPFCSKTKAYSSHSSGQIPFTVPHCLGIEAAFLRHRPCIPGPASGSSALPVTPAGTLCSS